MWLLGSTVSPCPLPVRECVCLVTGVVLVWLLGSTVSPCPLPVRLPGNGGSVSVVSVVIREYCFSLSSTSASAW